jgi:chromate transporter
MSSAVLEVFLVFLRLGLTSFGGPIAHLGYFQREFVERRRWITDADYADIVALCQVLPGPTSSQVGVAIGLQRAGPAGAAAAWLGLTAPSAIAMALIAGQVSWFATRGGAALAHGLQLVAAAVVAHAVVLMAKGLSWRAWPIALAALGVLLFGRAAWLQPAVIIAGGVIGLMSPSPAAPHEARRIPWRAAVLTAALVAAFAMAGPLIGGPGVALFATCFRAGALVFGGGHVVLPLLQADFIGRGWIGAADFLAGYGAAQAMPGPLFSFASFLGAASSAAPGGGAGAGIALVGLFLPGLALMAALLPTWRAARTLPWAQGFSRGAGAAVVGVLAAALYNPILVSAARGPIDLAIATGGFLALLFFKAPSWLVVLAVAAAGVVVALA